jgi:hypothetical protein
MKLILTEGQELAVVFTQKDIANAQEYLVYLLDTGRISMETYNKCMTHLKYGELPSNVIPFPNPVSH